MTSQGVGSWSGNHGGVTAKRYNGKNSRLITPLAFGAILMPVHPIEDRMERYHVRIAKDDLVFSASHFITFEPGVCERLHGHNYRVAVEIAGPLDANHYVVDFLALTAVVRGILADFDHRVILPTRSPRIRVVAGDEVEATFDRRRWVFPREDCLLLEIPNTTAELLAQHIARRLRDELAAKSCSRPDVVRVEIDECYGQSATCELAGED